MTTFKAALGICGLSQEQARIYLGVSKQSVKDWSAGKKSAPPMGVWRDLARLMERIEDAADFASSNIEPGLMDKQKMNNVTADNGAEPLPDGADNAAGAMALLLAIRDMDA